MRWRQVYAWVLRSGWQSIRFAHHLIKTSVRYRLPGLASEMAYNWMLALFPLILTLLTAVGLLAAIGLFESPQFMYQRIMDWIRQFAPEGPLTLVDAYVQAISYGQNGGLFSLSFVGTVWTASNALNAAMIALDISHKIPSERRRSFWQRRLLAILLTISILALSSLAIVLIFLGGNLLQSVALEAGAIGLSRVESGLLGLWRGIIWLTSLGMIALACAAVYQSGPSLRRPEIPILPGAIGASLIWLVSTMGLRVFMLHFGSYNRAYGTVGAMIVLLLWLWLSSLALLLGDQVNLLLLDSRIRSSHQKLAHTLRKGSNRPTPNPKNS